MQKNLTKYFCVHKLLRSLTRQELERFFITRPETVPKPPGNFFLINIPYGCFRHGYRLRIRYLGTIMIANLIWQWPTKATTPSVCCSAMGMKLSSLKRTIRSGAVHLLLYRIILTMIQNWIW
jgi:hypothetical protein